MAEATPAAIKAARGALSQAAADALVGVTRDAWAKLEAEGGPSARAMPAGTWALFLLATGQHPTLTLSLR